MMNDFNEQLKYENLQKSLSEKLEEQLNSGEKMSKVLDGLEIKPNTNYVLVKPYVGNPYERAETRESGIILDSNAASFTNPDSGDEEQEQRGIIIGRVIEIGPECKYVKEGDDIYYHFGSAVPIPFFRQGFTTISESRILMILNTKLNERFK